MHGSQTAMERTYAIAQLMDVVAMKTENAQAELPLVQPKQSVNIAAKNMASLTAQIMTL